jgi:hypothetical protein
MKRLAVIAWWSVCVIATIFFEYKVGHSIQPELAREIAFECLVFAGLISFPLGLVALFFVTWVIRFLWPSVLSTPSFEVMLIMVVATAFGYAQWFILIPRVIKVLRSNRRQVLKNGGYRQD